MNTLYSLEKNFPNDLFKEKLLLLYDNVSEILPEEVLAKLKLYQSLKLYDKYRELKFNVLNDLLHKLTALSPSDLSLLLMGQKYNETFISEYFNEIHLSKKCLIQHEILLRYSFPNSFIFKGLEWACNFKKLQSSSVDIPDKTLKRLYDFRHIFNGYLCLEPNKKYENFSIAQSIILGVIAKKEYSNIFDADECKLYYIGCVF